MTTATRPPDPHFVWSADEIRRVGHRIVDLIAEHVSELPDRAVFRPFPPDAADAMLASAPPEHATAVDALLDEIGRDITPFPFGNGHPRFYGWVNSPPVVLSALIDALASAMNPSVAGGNHAAVYVERQVAHWFKQLLGFPPESMGLLVSGTSSAALTALAVARHEACRRHGWDVRAAGVQTAPGHARPRLLVYRGAEGHGCHQKAVELLGLGHDAMRIVPADASLRMQPDALDAMLREDLAAGHLPIAVIASAGTVNTGAIDPLGALADVCARYGVWFHVDGAYGAPAVLLDEFREALAPIARADSVAVDPHKWLYVPVDAGLVLIRDARAMRDAFSLVPPYLRTDGDERGIQGPPWMSEYGIEQTRPFRGLRVWTALRYFGLEGYRALLGHDVAMARRFADRVRETPGLELWEPQGLGIVCFRAVPAAVGNDPTRIDALNRALLHRIQLGGDAFLSSTVLEGRFWLRACIVNPRATERDIEAVVAVVGAAIDAVARG